MFAALTGLGLSAAAGLNAFIPMLVVGLLDRYGDLVRLPAEFGWLTNGWVLLLLGALLAVEVVLDKVPVVDSVNDAVQTFVRPAAGGAVFAATDAAGRFDSSDLLREHSWIGWAAGILVALGVHAAKASARPFVNAGTAGTGAPVVSTAEDTVSLVMSITAIVAPIVALILLLLLAYAAFRLIRRRRRKRRRAA
ncbi:DUF4126 domain-containing protein [Spirillospora albida]|uniref:DUF4126 domain-containing protein n=1 Tax=Spirillospora albida TaxID=58123 RepID=UPI0004C11118|nr:DUF4126 domain-containing protein [Spirillospora albida]